MRGDANQNGSFDISDGIAITNYLFLGDTLNCLDAADLNDDGEVTLADANAVQGFLFLGTHPRPAAPHPQAGTDPTDDGLNCSGIAATRPTPSVARIPTPAATPAPGATPTATPQPSAAPVPFSSPVPQPTPLPTPLPVVVVPKPTVSVGTQRVMSANFIDTDYDGLSDILEKTIGTKTDNPDSDGDGFRDGAETLAGFSAVSAGNRKIAQGPYGLPRLTARQQAAVWRDLRAAVLDLNKGKLPPTLRNAKNVERAVYAYLDGAPAKAISDTYRLGAAKASGFHPTIAFGAWQQSSQYQRYLAVQGDPTGGGAALPTLQFRRGDANIDGQVDLSDVVRISMKFTQDQPFACDDAADVNDDGRLDISDMIFLSSWYSQSTKEPPAPGPYTMGPDPTADSLGCASYPNQPAPTTLTVALAADTPPAGTVNPGTERAFFTAFTLNAQGGVETPIGRLIFVDSITVERRGDATDDAFSCVRLLDGDTLVTFDSQDGCKRLDGNHRVVFNSDFPVQDGHLPKKLIIAADLTDARSNIGRQAAFAVVAVATVKPAQVAGLPVVGNPQTVAGEGPRGSLGVSFLDTPVSQTVIAGTKNFHAGTLGLDASRSGSDVNLTGLSLFIHATNTAATVYDNLKLYDGDVRILIELTGAGCTNERIGAGYTEMACGQTFRLAPGALTVTRGTVKTVRVLGDVAASDTTGSFHLAVADVRAADAQGAVVTPTYGRQTSNTMFLASGGLLTISALTQNHPAGLLPANTNGIEVGVFQMNAVREPIRVEKIYLSADSTRPVSRSNGRQASAFNQVRAIHLYDGATRLTPEGGIQPTSTDQLDRATVLIDVTNNPIIVPNLSSKDITVKVDTNAVTRYPSASAGDPGQGFVLSIAASSDVVAKGSGSATWLASTDIVLSGSALNAYTVWNTVPIVTVYNDLPVSERIGGSASLPRLSAGSQKELYKFRVRADSAGDVYVQQVTFNLDQQKATVTNTFITRADTGAQVAATSTSALATVISPSRRAQNFSFWFTSDGLSPRPTTIAPQAIPAGAVRLYALRGDVSCWRDHGCGDANPSGSLSVSFLGDSGFPTGPVTAPAYPQSAVRLYNPGANVNRLVWSDASIMGPLGIASGTATTSEQWTNGFRVASAVSSIGRLQATTTDVQFTP